MSHRIRTGRISLVRHTHCKPHLLNLVCVFILFLPSLVAANATEDFCALFPDLCDDLEEANQELQDAEAQWAQEQRAIEEALQQSLQEFDALSQLEITELNQGASDIAQLEQTIQDLEQRVNNASPLVRSYLQAELDRINQQYLQYRNEFIDRYNTELNQFVERIAGQVDSALGSRQARHFNRYANVGPPTELVEQYHSNVGLYFSGDAYAIPFYWRPVSFANASVTFIDGQNENRWVYQVGLQHYFSFLGFEARHGLNQGADLTTPFYGLTSKMYLDTWQVAIDVEEGELADNFRYQAFQFSWSDRISDFSQFMLDLSETRYLDGNENSTISLFRSMDASVGYRYQIGRQWLQTDLNIDFSYRLPNYILVEYLGESFSFTGDQATWMVGLSGQF